MTIEEARYQYGTKTMTVSKGTTITSLVRQLYNSDDPKYENILRAMNWLFDWQYMECRDIEYLSKDVCDSIDQLW